MSLSVPKYIAHRGANRLAPENTLAAMDAAHHCGFSWMEFDVQLTSDHKLILMHDQTLLRTTGYAGEVQDFSSTELCGIHANAEMPHIIHETTIPTLDAILDRLHDYGMGANIEIKTLCDTSFNRDSLTSEPLNEDLLSQTAVTLCNLLKSRKDTPPVIISSFSMQCLKIVRTQMPTVPIGLLVFLNHWKEWSTKFPFIKAALSALNAYSLHINQEVLTPSTLSILKQVHPMVLAYTVNQFDRAKDCLSHGVHSLFTDNHDLVTD